MYICSPTNSMATCRPASVLLFIYDFSRRHVPLPFPPYGSYFDNLLFLIYRCCVSIFPAVWMRPRLRLVRPSTITSPIMLILLLKLQNIIIFQPLPALQLYFNGWVSSERFYKSLELVHFYLVGVIFS